MLVTLLFVMNPISGGKLKTEHKAAITNFYKNLPYKINFFYLNGKNDSEELKKCIEVEKPQKVVAVGGDGTVRMVARQILGTDMQLGILPAGSANGMARELNISEDTVQALQIIEKNIVRKLDILYINNEICLHLSDIGVNARLIKYFEQGNMRGKLGYAKVALKALFKKRNIRVIINAKDREIKRDAFMVVLANASKYGTGALINPKGDLYDGLFEVVIIRHIGILTLLKVWFKPRSLDSKKIEIIQAESVHIETHRKVDFQVDGEYIGKVNIVNAEILPEKVNIIVPE